MEERDGEGKEGVGDLQRCGSLNTEQSSDNTVCLMAKNYSFQLRRTADIFSHSLGSIIFKEMTLDLM